MQDICSKEIRCADNSYEKCSLPAGHTGGCNPFYSLPDSPVPISETFTLFHLYTDNEVRTALLTLYHARVRVLERRRLFYPPSPPLPRIEVQGLACADPDKGDHDAWWILQDMQSAVCLEWGRQQVNRLTTQSTK